MADKNLQSYADQDGLSIAHESWAGGLDYDDILKCSKLTNSSFLDCEASGGRENALDCNRLCHLLDFISCRFIGGEQAAVVVKGGCKDIFFHDCTITPSKKSWTDVLWDDWSDQSKEPSTGDISGLHRLDGKPVRVVFGRWRKPTMGDHQKVLWIPTIGLHVYNIVKGWFVA